MAQLEIIKIPIGSQLTSTIQQGDPESQNDFDVIILADGNVTGLTLSNLSVSAGSIVALEGENSVWRATVRPPTSAQVITFSIAQNAVDQGNPATSLTIRVSTDFPDDDAETMTESLTGITGGGIALTPTRILIASGAFNQVITLKKYTHAGVEQAGEMVQSDAVIRDKRIDYINGDIIVTAARYDANLNQIDRLNVPLRNISHSRLGFVGRTDSTQNTISTIAYGDTTPIIHDISISNFTCITHADDLLYLGNPQFFTNRFQLAEITDNDEIRYLGPLNVNSASITDIAIYGDTLYVLGGSNGIIYTLDIRPYRPMAKNTKTTIYPVFVDEGDTLDLTQFAPEAEKIVFDVGSNKPPYLSINTANGLAVSSSAVTETTPVLVRCLAINRIDSQPFSLYLIIRQASNPKWREIETLSMRAGSSVNLFDYVDADSISFRSGRTQPTDSTLANGIFTIDTTGGRASFTARKGSRSTHTEINVHVIQQSMPENFSDIFRHRVEIGGIDVSSDVSEFPTVSKSLDDISLNEYRANEVNLTLKSGRSNNYRYNNDVDGNFWQANGLNPAGFQVPIHISVESLVDDEYISHLLFAGVIINAKANLEQTRVELRCVDISTELENTLVQGFGTLEKYDTLRLRTDEISFQGIYTPESSLLPMQTHNAQAWSHLIKLKMRQLALPSEGQAIPNTAYLTPQELLTSGGVLDQLPILRFKSQHSSEDVRFLVNQIALNKKVYNVEIDLPAVSLDTPFILNRGSIPFSVENTRTTRLLTDWVYDPSNDRIPMLLSNAESQINDLFVQYDVEGDSYRILHTFDNNIAVHRIERRNATNYYILTSGKITQDRSARQLPRQTDSTGYAYDSVSEGSEIKIYHYSTSTGILTEHVAEDDTYPPQLGIHYPIGFENKVYVDEHEGIVSDYRGAFKWVGRHLYYRYATGDTFGVARVNASGTTAARFDETIVGHNHLNFAFDVTSTETVYFVYSETYDASVYDGNFTNSITNFNHDLSAISVPVQLRVFISSISQLFSNRSLTITGTDISGNTITENFDLSSYQSGNIDLTTTQPFATITDFQATGFVVFQGSRIKIIAVADSALTIKRRTNNGTETTILTDTKALSALTDLDAGGGAYLGCHECLFHNNQLYILAPIQRVDENSGTYTRSRENSAGMILYRCDVTAQTPSLTVLDKWDYVHQGGCNLTITDGAVHYLEQPPASTRFKPINPDLDGYWTDEQQTQTMGYNTVEESIGVLKKVDASGEVQDLGTLWFEERPYNVSLARCLSFDNELHIVMGYGDPQHLLRLNSLASQAQNFQHLVFGKKLHYVVPEFDTNGSRFALLADLAKKTNATLSFREGLIRISDRSPFRAETDGQTGTGTGNLDFDNAKKQFPDTGYLFIGKEILKYTGITAGAFTGIQRGVLGTQVINHANNTPILYLDALIETQRLKSMPSIETDTNRIHNVIRNNNNTTEETDPDSITAYGELPYNLDLGLTPHESAWEEHISKDYVTNLKDPHPLIPLTLMPTFYLELEQFVGFRYADLVYAVQIVSITYSKQSTTIRGRVI